MSFGICNLSVIPCRKESSSKSEMVTQLLFGETFKVIVEDEGWAQIVTTFDNYECWINASQYMHLTPEEFNQITHNSRFLVNDIISVITNKTDYASFPCVAGSSLPNFEDDNFEITDIKFNYEGELSDSNQLGTREKIVEKAYEFLNSPYLWGGRTALGIDCSGLTQLVYKLNGYILPRDAYQQANEGNAIDFVEEAKEGDLAFFDNEEGKITHVGIVLRDSKILHASGQVRIDKFDHNGIFNEAKQEYTHKLRIIKQILED